MSVAPVNAQPTAGGGASDGTTIGAIIDCVNDLVAACEQAEKLLRKHSPKECKAVLAPAKKLADMLAKVGDFGLNDLALPIPDCIAGIVGAVAALQPILDNCGSGLCGCVFEKFYPVINTLFMCAKIPCCPFPCCLCVPSNGIGLGEKGKDMVLAGEIIDKVLEILQPAYEAAEMLMGGGMPSIGF